MIPVSQRACGPIRGGEGRQAGLTVVELLVGLAVGLFLTAGIVHILVSSQESYRVEESFARVQENGRYAVQVLSRDARLARNLGCRSLMLDQVEETLSVVACSLLAGQAADPPTCTGDPVVDADEPIGADATFAGGNATKQGDWTGVPAAVTSRWLRGDVLVVWGVTGAVSYVTNALTTRAGPITVQTSNPFEEGDLALLTDCEGSDIFSVSSVSGLEVRLATTNSKGTAVNAFATLSRAYNDGGSAQLPGARIGAMLFPFDYRIYFICTSNQTGRPSLCRWRASDGVQELVSDIYDMRITYSADTNGDGTLDTFTVGGATVGAAPASAITSALWPSVYSAEIELLAGSEGDNVRAEAAVPSSTDWPGAAEDRLGAGLPSDRRIYQRFVFTAAFRTRIPWYD